MRLKNWKLKALTQKAISFLPFSYRINYLFQLYITKGVVLDDHHFRDKLQHALFHLNVFKGREDLDLENCRCLELGSGWYPVVPVMLWLSGMKEVVSFDIYPWMNKTTICRCLSRFTEFHKTALRSDPDYLSFKSHILPDRWLILENTVREMEHLSFGELCNRVRLSYRLQDARKTGYPVFTFNFISSNNTFEHVDKVVLKEILDEFKRVLKPGGVMSHFIDMSDHFAHFDASISIYNFLKYKDSSWKLIDNNIQPQNRMRYTEYVEMYAQTTLPVTEVQCRPGDVEELKGIRLAERFMRFTAEENAVSHAYMISIMPEMK